MSVLKRWNGTSWEPVLTSTNDQGIIAAEYEIKPYNIGDFVVYNNRLYKCKTAIPVGELWSSNKWDDVLITDEIKAFITDKTLTIENRPADAAIVGTYINANNVNYTPTQIITQGGLTSGGAPASSSSANYLKRCKTDYIQVPTFGIDIEATDGYKFNIFKYTLNNQTTFLEKLSDVWVTSYHVSITPGQYIRILIAKSDESQELTPEDCINKISITALTNTDETISKQYKAADAKVVGENFCGVFDSSQTYITNDITLYQGNLYTFMRRHTGEWNADDVIPITFRCFRLFASDITKQLFQLSSNTFNVEWYMMQRGVVWWTTDDYTIPATRRNIDRYDMASTELIPCQPGDTFTAKIYGDVGGCRAYTWLKNDLTIISRSANSNNVNGSLIAPDEASYLVCNTKTEFQDSSYTDYYIFKGTPILEEINTELEEIQDNIEGLQDNLSELTLQVETDVQNLADAIGTTNEPVALNGAQSHYYWRSVNSPAVLTEISTGWKAYEPVELEANKNYYVTIFGGSSSNQNPILLVDENYNIIRRFGVSGYNNISFTANTDEKYILMTTQSGHAPKIYQVVFNSIGKLSDKVSTLTFGQYDFKNKTVAIIGDSISTNGDYAPNNLLGNVPEIIITDDDIGVELSAYVTWYDVYQDKTTDNPTNKTIGGHTITEEEIGTEITFTPIEGDQGTFIGTPLNNNSASRYVWWEVASDVLGFNPIPVCWSGSSITSHEANTGNLKTSYAWHDSQIRKCGIRTPGTMERTAPDIIIIYRGTNDFSHSPYARLTPNYFNNYIYEYPITDYIEPQDAAAYYGYLEGIMMTVGKLRQAYPSSIIVLCTLNIFRRVVYDNYPTRNGSSAQTTLPMYNNAIRDAANYLGCYLIEFDKDGITWENCSSEGYITDSQTKPTHPNDKGHKVMGNRAILDLLRINSLE